MTPSNSRPSSEAPGFSPAHAARAEARALRNLITVLTLVALAASPRAQVQGAPQPPASPAVGTGLIAGQIVDQDTGRGIAGAPVSLSTRPAPGAPMQRPASVAADSQGRFFFGALPAGGYAVMAQVPGHTLQLIPRILELSDGAKVVDVKINLRRLGSLNGRVLDDSGTPVVNMEMVLLTRLVNQGRPPALMPTMRTRTNDRGEYRFWCRRHIHHHRRHAGTVHVWRCAVFRRVSDSVTWGLATVAIDGTDVTDRAFDVSAETPPKEIVATITNQWQAIAGRVTNTEGAGVSDYTMLVFPVDEAYWLHNSRRIVTTQPTGDGRYQLGGPGPALLPAGEYYLAAVTDVSKDEQYDPAFLKALIPAAIKITLGAGERKTQDVRVQ